MEGDPTRTLKVETSRIQAGQILAGKYRIVREIGRGGMGIVYEAEDLKLKRTVALKFLPPGLIADPEARERFIHEAQAASALDHPHICTIHEVDESEAGGLYIAMACYKGESLKDKLSRGPIEAAAAVRIALEVADGLAKAHDQGIVHRDVKPGNIMITADGIAKVLDFGLAKLAGEARLTLPGTTVGTVAYMSPEQARGDELDGRTDVWSLGVILYEMVTGELPFGGEREQAILHAILHESPRPAKKLRPGYPAELAGVIGKALVKDPAGRFASAREMAESLRGLLAKMGSGPFQAARHLSFGIRRKRVWLTAGVAGLILVAAAIWLFSRPGIAFESRDRLMVADAENLTGEKVFDLALRTALEASLQQSPYAAVFDKPQMGETLRLMRLDPSARVDEDTGYEVCRFAGVRAFVLPRIMAAGEAYELEAILIDPVRRRHVDRIRVTARGREDVLLKGIDQLAKKLRSRLGESLNSIEKADASVATVTTASWEALDYFSLAQARREFGKFKEAAALYELALEKDEKFAIARASLGLIQIQFLSQADKGKEMLRRALLDAEANGLPQRDILHLKAVNRQFVDGDLEGALSEYRTIAGLFPDLMPPVNNAGRILQALGRLDEAAAMFEEAAGRAPKSLIPLQNLWYLHIYSRKDVPSADAVGKRLVALAPNLAISHSLRGFTLAVLEKFGEAEQEFRATLAIEPDHPYALPNLGCVLYAMGRPAEAVPIYRRVVELVSKGKTGGTPEWDGLVLALALRDSGQPEEARKIVADVRAGVEKKLGGAAPGPGQWILFGALEAVAGNVAEAEAILKRIRPAEITDPNDLMDLAELCALLGRTAPAIENIRKSLAAGFSDPFFPVILPELQSIRKNPEFRAIFKLDR